MALFSRPLEIFLRFCDRNPFRMREMAYQKNVAEKLNAAHIKILRNNKALRIPNNLVSKKHKCQKNAEQANEK